VSSKEEEEKEKEEKEEEEEEERKMSIWWMKHRLQNLIQICLRVTNSQTNGMVFDIL
jgi:two-component sensor histidine kinase